MHVTGYKSLQLTPLAVSSCFYRSRWEKWEGNPWVLLQSVYLCSPACQTIGGWRLRSLAFESKCKEHAKTSRIAWSTRQMIKKYWFIRLKPKHARLVSSSFFLLLLLKSRPRLTAAMGVSVCVVVLQGSSVFLLVWCETDATQGCAHSLVLLVMHFTIRATLQTTAI